MTTADGKHLEQWVLNRNYLDIRESSHQFPRKHPSRTGWQLWDEFWTSWLGRQCMLPAPLGQWLAPSHQKWGWYYNPSDDILLQEHTRGWTTFHASSFGRVTRGNKQYSPALFENDVQASLLLPASVVE